MAAEPMPIDNARAGRRMLSILFGSKADDLNIVLFRLNPARSVSFDDVLSASSDARGQSDVYTHV